MCVGGAAFGILCLEQQKFCYFGHLLSLRSIGGFDEPGKTRGAVVSMEYIYFIGCALPSLLFTLTKKLKNTAMNSAKVSGKENIYFYFGVD